MAGYLLYLQRTAGNQAVNWLLRQYRSQQLAEGQGSSHSSQGSAARQGGPSALTDQATTEIGTGAHRQGANLSAARAAQVVQRVEWDKKIAYKDGDLIYGVSPHYGNAVDAVKKKGPNKPQDRLARVQSFIDYVMPDEDGETYENLAAEAKSKDDEQFFLWLTTKSKYKDKIKKRLTKQDMAALKRVCKAAIQYIAAGERSKENKIHFILAGMDPKKSADWKEKGTTNKELRSIRRTWESVKSSVLFYDDTGDIVKAPWVEGNSKAAWEAYDQYRQTKKPK